MFSAVKLSFETECSVNGITVKAMLLDTLINSFSRENIGVEASTLDLHGEGPPSLNFLRTEVGPC